MPKFRKSGEELAVELAEQVAALRAAADGYDGGQSWQAKQLANVLYILLHDGSGRTKSLLGLVGLKGSAKFISSLVVPPSYSGGKVTSASATSLLMIKVSPSNSEYIPALGEGPFTNQFKWMAVSRWWEEVVFHPISGFNLSRKNIIFLMRSQDGGAHVDSHRTNEQYDRFFRGGDPMISQGEGGVWFGGQQDKPVPGAARALVRQLAWEADESLKALGL